MKASELVEKLQNMIAENGDVNVAIQDLDHSQAGWINYVDYDVSSDGDDIIVIQSHRMYSDDMILSYEDED